MTRFHWNKSRLDAAELLAAGQYSHEEIAARVGITRQGLVKWRQHPEFTAKVAALIDEFESAVRKRGVARRARRLQALNDRHQRLEQVMTERAADPLMQDAPGGRTGLLVRQVKLVKVYNSGADRDKPNEFDAGKVLVAAKHSVEVAEYAVDTGLLKELRELEKQIAQELGQWTEKREITGNVSGSVEIRPIDYRSIVAPLLSDESDA